MIQRIKSTGFWVSMISAVFLILGAFGVEIGDETASSVINAVCSLLVMLGIVKPTAATPPDDEAAWNEADEADQVDEADEADEKRQSD